MAEPILTPIYQDFTIDMSSNNNFIQVPSVQGDGNSVRYIRLSLISNGYPYDIPNNVAIYVAGIKPDKTNIFNSCELTQDGRILVEITSQMAAASGRGYYQIMFVDATTNSQLKSFPFYIVTTKSFDAEAIISSNEYQALVEALAQMQADYEHYVVECSSSAHLAHISEVNAAESMVAAQASEDAAKASETASATSEANALTSENNAKTSETNSKASEINAKASEDSASASAVLAESWAVGGTDTRTGEDTNNSKYWAERAADWSSHDASHLTYTFQDGTVVNLADFLKVLEDADGETLLLL